MVRRLSDEPRGRIAAQLVSYSYVICPTACRRWLSTSPTSAGAWSSTTAVGVRSSPGA